ncbi:MAG: hypothetical protein K8953_02725, partial [Proteobacteria bacterium]|nr:hypothetical protein [Pseudomonadota bacterium]
DGAVGVFYNTTGDLYVGGFVVSPTATACVTNVFDTVNCPVNADENARKAYCLNTDDNGGTNPFNGGCDSVTFAGNEREVAQDAYCTTTSMASDGLCSGRMTTICTTSSATAPFSALCGTDTVEQLAACRGAVDTLPATDSCNSVGLSGVICGTSATVTGDNPFAPICGSSTHNSNFANLDDVQELECRERGSVPDGESSGKCFTIKNKFCDGAESGDNPYATVCGGTANAVNQEAFCESHRDVDSTNMGRCTNSRATVCRVNPFTETQTTNCLADGGIYFADERAARCSDGRTTSAALCNTTPISDDVCVANGARANPFATFCSTGTDQRTTKTMSIAQVRQAVYTSCLADSDATGVCANSEGARDTLRDTDCIVTNPSALFADRCDYAEFRDVEIDYCDAIGTAWEAQCNDVSSELLVVTARDNACLQSGQAANVACESRAEIRRVCNGNPFTRTTIGSDGDDETICTGSTQDSGGVTYLSRRNLCQTTNLSFTQTYCDAEDNDDGGSDTPVKTARDTDCLARGDTAHVSCKNRENVRGICDGDAYKQTTDTSANLCTGTSTTHNDTYMNLRTACETADVGVGSFAEYCDTQDASGAVQIARDNYCRDVALENDANCVSGSGHLDRHATFCPTDGASVFSALCGTNMVARDAACLKYGAGAVPGFANDCANRANVLGVCDTDIYKKTTENNNVLLCTGTSVTLGNTYSALMAACEDANAGSASFAEYCDTQDNEGAVKIARDNYCRDVAGANDAQCIAGSGHLDRQTTFCAEGSGTSVFSGVCGPDTAGQLAACRGAVNSLPATDSCNSDGLSGVICGTSATITGDNPFAPICGSNTHNKNYANLDAVQELECRERGSVPDGESSGKCFTIKDNFCDGDDVGDNPYATVCGGNANSANQESFCTTHGQANSGNMTLCSNSLATVCPGTPFRNSGGLDCLSNPLYANDRAEQCRVGTPSDSDCDTTTISNAVCIPSGTYANPFATFCETGDDQRTTKTDTITVVKQNFCGNTRTTDASQKETDCDTLQDGLCTGANSVSATPQGAAGFVCSTD